MRYESANLTDVTRYVNDAAWVMEQKADGIRCIARTDATGQASFFSHTGDLLKSGVRHFPALAAALANLASCTVDGELLDNGEFWLFDVLEILGTDTRAMPQSDRRKLLDSIAPAVEGTIISILPQATTPTEKADLWRRVQAESAEGVVVKRSAAPYERSAKRTKDVLKLKITRTVDVVITARNLDNHENAELGVYDANGRLTVVGRCSMLGKPNAQVGDVIEVQFLYLVGNGTPVLYQPRMMRARPDRTARSCEMDQFNGCVVSKKVLK